MTIQQLYDALEARIPRSLSCGWDNDGLSCCPDPAAPVRGVLVALDATEDAVAAAERRGCNLLVTHHPLLFRGLRAVDGADTSSRKVLRLIRAGISTAAFHTRLDALPGGVNDTLAAVLGLHDVLPFGSGAGEDGNPAGMPLGRIGSLPAPESFDAFCARVRAALHLPALLGAGRRAGGRCGRVCDRRAALPSALRCALRRHGADRRRALPHRISGGAGAGGHRARHSARGGRCRCSGVAVRRHAGTNTVRGTMP